MNPEMTAFKTMFDYKLEPEVYSFHLLDALIKEAEKRRYHQLPYSYKTGYGYAPSGLCPRGYATTYRTVEEPECCHCTVCILSHLVGSDASQFDAFTRGQIEMFEAASMQLQAAFPHKILRHICNSAGIERFPEHSSIWYVWASVCMVSVRSIILL